MSEIKGRLGRMENNAEKNAQKKQFGLSARKKTLMMSVSIFAFCITLLVGVTLAIFTNDIDDGTIGINTTAGSIQIDIIDEENASLIGEVLYFDKEEGGTKKILWEPGATFVTEGFKVYNNGTIPVNYQIYINYTEEDSDLVKVLNFWLTEDPTDLDSAVEITSYKGSLDVGKGSDTYYLVVQMAADAGNAYQGLELNGVGITVHAVQGNVNVGDVDFSKDNGIPDASNP